MSSQSSHRRRDDNNRRPSSRRFHTRVVGTGAALALACVGLAAHPREAPAYVWTAVFVGSDPLGDAGTITVIPSHGDPGFPVIEPPVGARGKVPPGTCGIRWTNPTSWQWSPDPDDLLPSSGTYTGFTELEFGGPYPGCKNGSYFFPFPLTVNGVTSPSATRLDVEVASMEDVEFLGVDGTPIAVTSEEPDGEPPDGDICTIPEFCESAELIAENVCLVPELASLCDATQGSRANVRRPVSRGSES
jgi:hypothetical protein